MINQQLLILVVLILNLFWPILAWPGGAPEKVCSTLLPKHGTATAKQANESPFMMEQSNNEYQPGDQIKVVLKSPSNVSFKGLIVQAIDPETGNTIGNFSQGRGLKIIDSCSSVTHSDNRNKKAAILVWNAPVNGQGGLVVFRGTVVQKYETFFKGLISLINPNL